MDDVFVCGSHGNRGGCNRCRDEQLCGHLLGIETHELAACQLGRWGVSWPGSVFDFGGDGCRLAWNLRHGRLAACGDCRNDAYNAPDLEKDGKAFATSILELRPKNEWYDYEAKYTKGMTEFILPAELSAEMTEKVKATAVKAFEVCGCSGVSRVDFLIVDNIPYVLEINTNPGMTDTSDLPAQAGTDGITYDMLVEMVLKSAGLNK